MVCLVFVVRSTNATILTSRCEGSRTPCRLAQPKALRAHNIRKHVFQCYTSRPAVSSNRDGQLGAHDTNEHLRTPPTAIQPARGRYRWPPLCTVPSKTAYQSVHGAVRCCLRSFVSTDVASLCLNQLQFSRALALSRRELLYYARSLSL